jgi:xanthine/uracil permease
MGVMAVTRVYSTLIFVVAAVAAIALGFSPKFGALLRTIPGPVLGGLAVVVFGLIASAMIRLWVDNRVDFSDPRNLLTVGVALVMGAGNFSVTIGGFSIAGIGTATVAAIGLYQLLGIGRREPVGVVSGLSEAETRLPH